MTGDGVGDDDLSWGYDGVRQRVWHGGNDERGVKYGKGDRPWREGDVVGCYLDTEAAEMRFALNGKDLGSAFDAEKVIVPRVGAFTSVVLLQLVVHGLVAEDNFVYFCKNGGG